MYWPDGKKYEGPWFAGKQHGIGKLYTTNEEYKLVEYYHGKIKEDI